MPPPVCRAGCRLLVARGGQRSGFASAEHSKNTKTVWSMKNKKSKQKPPEQAASDTPKKQKKGWVSTVILLLILVLGLGIMLYPTVSDWWNSLHASRTIASYAEAVAEMTEEEKQAYFDAAHAYNEALESGVHFTLSREEMEEYKSTLDLTGTGIMGYITISAININLPIYHTVEEAVLQTAVGHIPGSSLPVGGDTTHAVISGHRGLPRARLFTDLDKLAEGDTFSITVLDQTFTYKIDQIRIVEPEDTDELAIASGKDYCTLVTCTPYGINSHRMLLRGVRTDNAAEALIVDSDAAQIPSYIVIPAVGVPVLFLLLMGMLIYYRYAGKKKSGQEILAELKKQQRSDWADKQ